MSFNQEAGKVLGEGLTLTETLAPAILAALAISNPAVAAAFPAVEAALAALKALQDAGVLPAATVAAHAQTIAVGVAAKAVAPVEVAPAA